MVNTLILLRDILPWDRYYVAKLADLESSKR